jgi:RNA polymerase sigma-B factor
VDGGGAEGRSTHDARAAVSTSGGPAGPRSPGEPGETGPYPDTEKSRTELAQFTALRECGAPELREQLIKDHLALADHLAWRFGHWRRSQEDLVQVARLGLVKAVDRFDPSRGVQFSTYASATILGELKRHLRDHGWAVKARRSVQELSLQLSRWVDELSQEQGRSPTIPELSERAGVSEEEVLEALEVRWSRQATSLDAPVGDEGGDIRLVDVLGVEEGGYDRVEGGASVARALAMVPARERQLLYLRFWEGWSQAQIASRLGISQMHVSRLLARVLAQLRDAVADQDRP